MTLTKYCAPIRSTPVDKVDVKAILRVLEPIWTRAPETASRLRARIETVLAAAQVAGHIDPDKPNPARWKGWLDHMLANPKKIGERGNHAAMDWRDVPAFVAKLRDHGFDRERGARIRHPVASRTGEALDMTWDEVDLDDRPTWTIPKERMKMDRPHNVPLSPRAVDILRGQSATRPTSSFGPHPTSSPASGPGAAFKHEPSDVAEADQGRRHRLTVSGRPSARGAPITPSPSRSPRPASRTRRRPSSQPISAPRC